MKLVWVFLLAGLACADNCADLCKGVNNNCHIVNVTRICDSSFSITTGSFIHLTNSTISCLFVDNGDTPNCTIALQSESIKLTASMIVASLINITAGSLEIFEGSALNANGTGCALGHGLGYNNLSSSYGGFGGGSCLATFKRTTYGQQLYPSDYGSGTYYRFSNGGGWIYITAQNLTLRGLISACGNFRNQTVLSILATWKKEDFDGIAGGSGGTILINVTKYADAESGVILANGGDGESKGFGGGGGRVALYGKIGSVKVQARGGTGGNLACPVGGAGTIFRAEEKLLIVNNGDIPTSNPTTVFGGATLSLRVENKAMAIPNFSVPELLLKSLSVRQESSFDVAPTGEEPIMQVDNLTLSVNDTVTLSGKGRIGGIHTSMLQITAKTIIVNDGSITALHLINLTAQEIVIKGEVTKAGDSTVPSLIFMQVRDNFTLDFTGRLDAGKIGIIANFAFLAGNAMADTRTCTRDSTFFDTHKMYSLTATVGNLTAASNLMQSNFTMFVWGKQELVQEESSKITGARIGLFARNSRLRGVISAAGKGCHTNEGPGRGFSDPDCSGSGAGYGGHGGVSVPAEGSTFTNCGDIVAQGAPYSDLQNPWFEGSGGGSVFEFGGSGGGFVAIEALNSTSLSGIIDSDGSDGHRHPSDLKNGSGGGSGGGIFIATKYISFKRAVIEVNGGRGSMNGGGGAGGRVLFSWIGNTVDNVPVNVANNSNSWDEVSILVNGGAPGKMEKFNIASRWGEAGSIAAVRCAPGTANYTCQPCGAGRYKVGTNYQSSCIDCKGKPEMGIYVDNGGVNASCPYVCPSVYTSVEDNPLCKSPLEELFELFGSTPATLFSLIVILVLIALLPLGVSMLAKRYQVRPMLPSNNSMNYEEGLDRKLPSTKRINPELVNEDLPFHERRVFLLGNNSFYQPWSLPKAPPPEIESSVDLSEYSNFATLVNSNTRWYFYQYFASQCFLWLYHPLGLFLFRTFRKKKFAAVRRFIQEYDEKMWIRVDEKLLSNSLRISCSDDYTVAYIDITSSRKKIVEWDERPSLPMQVLCAGDGSFWNPYHIDTKDLMIHLLSWRMEPEALEEYQNFLHLFNLQARTVRLGHPVPNKKQPEILELQALVSKYNEDLFNTFGYRLILVLFQALMVVNAGKYVQVQQTGTLNSTSFNSYKLDIVNQASTCIYSFKLGLIVTNYEEAPVCNSPASTKITHNYFAPNSFAAADSQSTPKIQFVNDPSDTADHSECSLRDFLLVNPSYNQYAVLFFLLLAIFIDGVKSTQGIALRVLTETPLEQSYKKLAMYFLVLPGANITTLILSLVHSTQLMPVLPSLIPAYISFQLASIGSTLPFFVYYIWIRPSWFSGLLMGLQIVAKVASLRLAAIQKAKVDSFGLLQVRNTQKQQRTQIVPRSSR